MSIKKLLAAAVTALALLPAMAQPVKLRVSTIPIIDTILSCSPSFETFSTR